MKRSIETMISAGLALTAALQQARADAVAANPNIIGYVDRSFVNITVRILHSEMTCAADGARVIARGRPSIPVRF